MLRSALGQAASIGDYDVVKKRLLASDYTMNFTNGVTFDLNVKTSDTMTATTMATLLKAGVLYRKMNATPTEKLALDDTTVDNSHDMLEMHFKTDDQRFTALLKSDLFAAVFESGRFPAFIIKALCDTLSIASFSVAFFYWPRSACFVIRVRPRRWPEPAP